MKCIPALDKLLMRWLNANMFTNERVNFYGGINDGNVHKGRGNKATAC